MLPIEKKENYVYLRIELYDTKYLEEDYNIYIYE